MTRSWNCFYYKDIISNFAEPEARVNFVECVGYLSLTCVCILLITQMLVYQHNTQIGPILIIHKKPQVYIKNCYQICQVGEQTIFI